MPTETAFVFYCATEYEIAAKRFKTAQRINSAATLGSYFETCIMAFRFPDSCNVPLEDLAQVPPVSEGVSHSIERANHTFHVKTGLIIPERAAN